MREIEIEYCVPCGYLGRAEQVEHALLSELGRRLDSLRLKPSRGGVFQVRLDGEPIYDRQADPFDADEIVRRAAERLGQAAGEPVALRHHPG